MDKITKNLQFILLSIILISTVISVGIELKRMILEQSVNLADLLLMFLYTDFVSNPCFFYFQYPMYLSNIINICFQTKVMFPNCNVSK